MGCVRQTSSGGDAGLGVKPPGFTRHVSVPPWAGYSSMRFRICKMETLTVPTLLEMVEDLMQRMHIQCLS